MSFPANCPTIQPESELLVGEGRSKNKERAGLNQVDNAYRSSGSSSLLLFPFLSLFSFISSLLFYADLLRWPTRACWTVGAGTDQFKGDETKPVKALTGSGTNLWRHLWATDARATKSYNGIWRHLAEHLHFPSRVQLDPLQDTRTKNLSFDIGLKIPSFGLDGELTSIPEAIGHPVRRNHLQRVYASLES